jgi:hypothetical protein
MHRRHLSKQSLQGQVSAKLTLEICINNASSNSRLTAAGRQVTAAGTILRTVSRLFFFFASLPLMREQPNYTCKLKTYWNCIAFELGTLGAVFFVLGYVDLFYFMCTLWWDNYRTTSEAPSPGLETETDTQIIKTETSLHLNLEVFGFLDFWFFKMFYLYTLF